MLKEMALKPNIKVLRQIISELRKTTSAPSVKENLTLQYIFNQFRKYQATEEQLCKAQEEMTFMANTYLCYLQSSRLHQQISNEFHGKGERSISDTAKLVGFKLPHDPE